MLKAQSLLIEKWINAPENYNLDIADGLIKIIHVFQMLCPGCVYKGIPQAIELYQKYNSNDIKVIGLHSVFEHHHAMQPHALEVFVSEWALPFPVAIDQHIGNQTMPETMKNYRLMGTPTLIIIDHLGYLKLKHFGHLDQERVEVIIEDTIRKMKLIKNQQ